MDPIRKITILIFLYIRNEISESEENELAVWRKMSPESEKLFLELTDMKWVKNYIQKEMEEDAAFEKLLEVCRPRLIEKLGYVENSMSEVPGREEKSRVNEKTAQEYQEEDLALWPQSNLEYWMLEMEDLDEYSGFAQMTTIRERVELLLSFWGLPKTDPKKKIAALLYLYVRNETSSDEEKQLEIWRDRSVENHSVYEKLTSREYSLYVLWQLKDHFAWGTKKQKSLSRMFYTRDASFDGSPVDAEIAKQVQKIFEKGFRLSKVSRLEYCVGLLRGMDDLIADEKIIKMVTLKATIAGYFQYLLCLGLLPIR